MLCRDLVAKDGTVLSGLIDENGNLTDDTENIECATIINFSNNGDFTYDNDYEISRDNVDNNIETMSYYNDENDKNTTGCSNDYNNSFIKNIVNNWSNDFNNDLKEVEGYKVRLITNDELKNMGHIFYRNSGGSMSQKSTYNCLYSDADYWTMSTSIDSSSMSDIVSKIDANNELKYVDSKYAVRPVINLKKCTINRTC